MCMKINAWKIARQDPHSTSTQVNVIIISKQQRIYSFDTLRKGESEMEVIVCLAAPYTFLFPHKEHARKEREKEKMGDRSVE